MNTDTNTRIHLLNVRLYGSLKQSKPMFMMDSKKPVTFWLKSRENELATQSLQTEISKETKETKSDFK